MTRSNMSDRNLERPTGDATPGHAKQLSESAPAALVGATGNGESDIRDGYEAPLVDHRRPSVAKGSKKMMKAIKKTANKANPLQFIQKTPPKNLGSLNDDDKTLKPKKSLWAFSQAPRQHQLVTDESEDAVLASIEQRGSVTKESIDGFRPAVPGERPPLAVPTLGNALQPPALKRDSSTTLQKKLQYLQLERQKSSKQLNWEGKHRRAKTLLTSMEHGNSSRRESDGFGFGHEGDHFWGLEKMYGNDESLKDDTELTDDDNFTTDDEQDDGKVQQDDANENGETLPLLSTDVSDYGDGPTISERQLKARKVLKRSSFQRIREMLSPKKVLKIIWRYILHSSLTVCIPLFVIAWILFYYCGNPPPPDFLPGSATLAWWFNFTGNSTLL